MAFRNRTFVMRWNLGVACLLLSFATACSDSTDGSAPDGSVDAGSRADGGHPDFGLLDSGVLDAGPRPTANPVSLGAAGQYVILAQSGVSSVPISAVTGDVAVSPAAATFITGFSLTVDATTVFASSPQVTGRVFAADYAPPTPSNLTTAVADMHLAYTDAAGRAPDVTELGAGNIGGMTLTPGVYQWGTELLIPADLTLTGTATGVFVFQIAQNLTLSSATRILLTGGASPKNVYWQVAGLVDVGTTAHLEGVVLSATSITLQTGASIHGRLLAQTAVTIDSATVAEPAP